MDRAVAIVRRIVTGWDRNGEPNGHMYYASVYRESDLQYPISQCYHKHRSERQAEKCCRRLEREWNKTLEIVANSEEWAEPTLAKFDREYRGT